jgi:hypothetical protein
MTELFGRPGRRPLLTRLDPNAYLRWLARTHRYNSDDIDLATATKFAWRLAEASGGAKIGPAMISRLENGTARWRIEHLIAYARVLNISLDRLLAPAYKLGKTMGHSDIGGLLRSRYTDEDEQSVADLVDAVRGDDPVSTADWDLLSGYFVTTRRKLGMRTWAKLCERLLLEICTTQGTDQDIRAEALLRFITLEHVGDIANAEAIGTAEQAGNPMSFMPLKVFQRLPPKAPRSWIVHALLNPPDTWLLRELFTSVAVLVATGEWQPSSTQLAALRGHSSGAVLDTNLELEVRRASMQLLHTLDRQTVDRVLRRADNSELIFLAKPETSSDAQYTRYHAYAARLAAHVQDLGLRWQAKWATGEDHVLTEIVTHTLFGRRDDARASYTTLLINSGYLTALHRTVVDHLTDSGTYNDVTVTRALIRLLGKIATGDRAGTALLRVIDSTRFDVDTRIQACWALANAAPRTPSHLVLAALHACQRRPFGHQSTTALRAMIASCGRSGLTTPLRTLLDDHNVPHAARRECAWWLSLPQWHWQQLSTERE